MTLLRRVRPFLPSAAFVLFVGGALLASGIGAPAPAFCLFKAATGLPCPGCGITSSVLALCRGELARAWQLNPAGIAVVVFFASSAATAVGEAIAAIPAEAAARLRLIADKVLLACLASAWLAKALVPQF